MSKNEEINEKKVVTEEEAIEGTVVIENSEEIKKARLKKAGKYVIGGLAALGLFMSGMALGSRRANKSNTDYEIIDDNEDKMLDE